jgi:hypothetical protein
LSGFSFLILSRAAAPPSIPANLKQERSFHVDGQCFGSGPASGSADPHNFGNLDPHPYHIKKPDPHHSDKLNPEPDPDTHHFADDKPKCMEYGPILALFYVFEPLFGS